MLKGKEGHEMYARVTLTYLQAIESFIITAVRKDQLKMKCKGTNCQTLGLLFVYVLWCFDLLGTFFIFKKKKQ